MAGITSVAKFLVALSSLALLHAAYSTYEHLSTLKALGRPSGSLPTSIIVEALAALAVFVTSVALALPELEDVTIRGELAKRWPDDTDARPAFLRLSLRGRALFGDDKFSVPAKGAKGIGKAQ